MKNINFNFSNEVTRVFTGCGLFKNFDNFATDLFNSKCKLVIITDKKVFKLYANKLKQKFLKLGFIVLVFVVKCGEKFKNFKTLISLFNFLALNKIQKGDFIISIGGGVICDLSGFASGCFLRGLNLIHIPTTLLAMVDACVGGKAAVNLSVGKNLVGCFKQPVLVVCDPELVLTLSKLELFNGMAEIIKYAALFCEDFLNYLNSCHDVPRIYEIETMVYKSLLFKKKVVEFDEFDKKNERIKLNFGHTIGHAIETFYGYKKIKHGQAVSIGMSIILKQGEKFGFTKSGEFLKIKQILQKFKLPVSTTIESDKIINLCLHDKKNINGQIRLVLLKKIGLSYLQNFNITEFKNFIDL